MSMSNAVATYYDEFSRNFIRDYVHGNLRVCRQRTFLRSSVPPESRSVLVLGCGSGETCDYIARRVARQAQVLGVDISPQAIAMANRMFPHPRISYRVVDVTSESPGGTFDVIFLPDVYEHIPRDKRQTLHEQMAKLLAPQGRVLVTSPYPGAYWDRRREADDMQIIDEDVFLPDMVTMAQQVGGQLTYFNVISVWHPNDYFHAMAERSAQSEAAVARQDKLPIKGWQPHTWLHRHLLRLQRLTGLDCLGRKLRDQRARAALAAIG
jgi:SAM-dependent methyltransferase